MNEKTVGGRPSETSKTFNELANQTHLQMRVELQERVKSNPHPTEQEVAMGAFREGLEPQVRQALETMFKKGYSTSSSGFYGEDGSLQCIDGFFTIDEETEKKINALGARVRRYKNGYTWIEFDAESPDLLTMTNKWIQIAETLPTLMEPAVTNQTVAADEFHKKYVKS